MLQNHNQLFLKSLRNQILKRSDNSCKSPNFACSITFLDLTNFALNNKKRDIFGVVYFQLTSASAPQSQFP